MLICGLFGKPTFSDALFLFEELADGPEERCAEDSEDGGGDDVLDKEGGGNAEDAAHEEHPPEAGAGVIFRLDDYRMEKSDYQECADGYDYSSEVHRLLSC